MLCLFWVGIGQAVSNQEYILNSIFSIMGLEKRKQTNRFPWAIASIQCISLTQIVLFPQGYLRGDGSCLHLVLENSAMMILSTDTIYLPVPGTLHRALWGLIFESLKPKTANGIQSPFGKYLRNEPSLWKVLNWLYVCLSTCCQSIKAVNISHLPQQHPQGKAWFLCINICER